MAIQQISVFVGNQKGALAKTLRLLADSGIDLRALSIADTADFGILRFIASNNEKAASVLHANGMIYSETPVVAAYVPDQPGGLASELEALADAGINVEYTYAFVTTGGKEACVVLRVPDPAAAEAVLLRNNIRIASEAELQSL